MMIVRHEMLSRKILSSYHLILSIGAIRVIGFYVNRWNTDKLREVRRKRMVTPNWFSCQSKTTDRTLITYCRCRPAYLCSRS